LQERGVCDADDIIKISTEELKKIYEMPSRKVSNTFRFADRRDFIKENVAKMIALLYISQK
jgi:hypothetical protein